MGGNKARKLEFLIPDIIEKGADIVITTGDVQSNWAAQLAAVARNMNVEVLLVLRGTNTRLQGNYLLDHILGAKIKFVNISMDEYKQNITRSLLVIRPSNAPGCLSKATLRTYSRFLIICLARP